MHNNLDVSQDHCAQCKRPISKGYIFCDSMYRTFSKGQNCKDGEHVWFPRDRQGKGMGVTEKG